MHNHLQATASIWFENWGVMGLGLKTGSRGSWKFNRRRYIPGIL